ncbi:MAG: (d)CMP kinase [Bacteroidia bacterium]|nr:(d)CMP kinase [Bacteroidia bacterium]
MKRINIAIDGYSGCGKSTTARAVARHLGYTYIDTGAMYRAVTLYFLRHAIPYDAETPAMWEALGQIELHFHPTDEPGKCDMILNGENVEHAIRTLEVSQAVSPVSVHPVVRRALVAQQQQMGKARGVVMDGRDIGTVVFPDAELKVFMTAELEMRSRRRQAELAEKGIDATLDEIISNLQTRDQIDANRSEGPLRKADDAVEIDTTHITFEDQVSQVCHLAHARMEEVSAKV